MKFTEFKKLMFAENDEELEELLTTIEDQQLMEIIVAREHEFQDAIAINIDDL